jgi:hypothetical protein
MQKGRIWTVNTKPPDQGKLPGSAVILACGVSGKDRLIEAGMQGCAALQGSSL